MTSLPYPKELELFMFLAIIRPAHKAYNPGQSTKYYISNAGGLNDFADKDLIISVSPNGESRIIKNSLFSGSGKNIMPGSVFTYQEILES